MRTYIPLILLVVVAASLFVIGLDAAEVSPAERAAAAAWAAGAEQRAQVLELSLMFLAAVALVTVAGVAVAALRKVMIWSVTISPHKSGLYPLVFDGRQWIDHNQPGAQHMAALPARPTAALARALLAGPGRAGPVVVDSSVVDVTPYTPAFDLARAPHFLFAGQTGQGKTTAMWQVAGELARQYDMTWRVAEPGGANWKELATATSIGEIVQAVEEVHGLMTERLNLLRTSAADHVLELDLPFAGFILEEAESVYADLRLANRGQAQAMAIQLRQLAAMGRKAGIVLMFGTQTALRAVFDGAVLENIGNVYLFGGMQHLAERFRVGKAVRLPALATGQAYDPGRGQVVQFARASRPQNLRLAVRSAGTGPVREQNRAEIDGTAVRVPLDVPMPVDPADVVSEAQRSAVIAAWQRHGTIKGAQRELFPGQALGGHWFYWIRSIVEAET